MKCFEIGEQTGLASLRAGQREAPSPGAGDVALKVRAVALNHRDLLVLNGTYGARRPVTRVPVSDGVGKVVALGADTAGPAIGTRVVAPHFCTWLGGAFDPKAFATDIGISRDGWLAEQIVLPAAGLVSVPASVSDAQAVALSAAGLTAWNALVDVGRVKAGDVVLCLGTGGVSIMAMQIAKMHGARVIVTSSSDAKLELARSLGAEALINYRTTPDWEKAVQAATGGAGATIVIETGGLATLGRSIAAAAVNARIVLIGALAAGSLDAASPALANFSSIIGKNLTLRGITGGSRAMLQALVDAVAANRLAPVIDRSFGFDEAPAAYAYLASGDHFGKVAIGLD